MQRIRRSSAERQNILTARDDQEGWQDDKCRNLIGGREKGKRQNGPGAGLRWMEGQQIGIDAMEAVIIYVHTYQFFSSVYFCLWVQNGKKTNCHVTLYTLFGLLVFSFKCN